MLHLIFSTDKSLKCFIFFSLPPWKWKFILIVSSRFNYPTWRNNLDCHKIPTTSNCNCCSSMRRLVLPAWHLDFYVEMWSSGLDLEICYTLLPSVVAILSLYDMEQFANFKNQPIALHLQHNNKTLFKCHQTAATIPTLANRRSHHAW